MLANNIARIWEHRNFGLSFLRQYGIRETYARTLKYFRENRPVPDFSVVTSHLLDNEMWQFLDTDVLFVSSDLQSPSHSYRVDTLLAAFREIGLEASWVSLHHFREWTSMPSSVKLAIFWRTNVPFRDHPVLNRNLDTGDFLTAYDIDDLTFDQDVYTLENVAGLAEVSAQHRKWLADELPKMQAAQITDSSIGIAPTPRIASSYARLGTASIEIPIVIPRWMESQAAEILPTRPERVGKRFRIVYASGSKSHRGDFQSAWPALSQVLRTNRHVELHILGHSPIDSKEIDGAIKSQIIHHPYVAHHDLLKFLSDFDLQISPLELENEFVEAKSATKFMQGAAVGVPTIASPTGPFRNTITSSRDGWLAANTEEWVDALTAALDDTTRARVAKAAHATYLAHHTVSAIVPQARELAKLIDENETRKRRRREKKTSKIRRVTWVLPDLPSMSGGHRMVFRFAHYLPRAEFQSTIVILNTDSSDDDLATFVTHNYGLHKFTVTSDVNAISSGDFVFATHHSTVDAVKLLSRSDAAKCYIIQDFESLFNPMSDTYLHALESYFDKDFSIICGSEWMSRKILATTGRKVPFYEFPIESETYNWDSDDEVGRSGVLFFAKADSPRRIVDTGIKALQILAKLEPHLRIGMFGCDPNMRVDGITNHGRVPTLKGLAALYRTYKVGLAFSTTNPSLVPYEMMACGLVVSDVIVPDDHFPKFGSPPAAILTKSDPASIARGIFDVLHNERKWAGLQKRGLELTAGMPDEVHNAKLMREFLNSIS